METFQNLKNEKKTIKEYSELNAHKMLMMRENAQREKNRSNLKFNQFIDSKLKFNSFF